MSDDTSSCAINDFASSFDQIKVKTSKNNTKKSCGVLNYNMNQRRIKLIWTPNQKLWSKDPLS